MDELQNRIRERAYLLWVEEGRPHGRDEHHWHLAAQFIAMEEAAASASESVPPPVATPRKAAGRPAKPSVGAPDVQPKKPAKKAAAALTPAPSMPSPATPATAVKPAVPAPEAPAQAAAKVPSARKRSKTPVATAK